jgi:peptidoglycan-N-acetylglucosamine deacetylase
MDRQITRRQLIGAAGLAGLGAGVMLPEAARAVSLSNVRATVTTNGGLNLRAAPRWSSAVIAALPNGAPVSVLVTYGDWCKVKALGRIGFVNSWFVTLAGTPSTPIYRGSAKRKMIALTFDAGADLGSTSRILGTLKSNGIKASFGLTGAWTKANPRAAASIAAAGHQAINHTVDHPSYTGFSDGTDGISPARRLSELVRNEAILANAGVPNPKPYWRPPYGDINDTVLRDAGAGGYGKTVMWTVDSLGWNGATVDQIYTRVMNAASPGAIVLMHVGAESHDADALPRIVSALKSGGYSFGTVAQAIAP